jgi:hypothetical protein
VDALLAAGADTKTLNNFGWTASDLARAWGHHDIAQLLQAAREKEDDEKVASTEWDVGNEDLDDEFPVEPLNWRWHKFGTLDENERPSD